MARALIAAIIALALYAAAAFLILGQKGAAPADFIAVLQGDVEGGLLCRIAAWGAVIAGALGVLAVLAAFFEDPADDDGFRRRGFPKAIPLVLLIVGLVFLWAMFDCMAREARAPAATGFVMTTLEQSPPAPTEIPPAASVETAAPPVATRETQLDWQYLYPLVVAGATVQSPVMNERLAAFFNVGDSSGALRDMLCGKAWVAFTGASSEEGPRERNRQRARVRASIVAQRAESWLDAQTDDCARPVVLALALGQHALTGADTSRAGAATASQRRVLAASRSLAPGEEALTRAEARRELRDFLDATENRRALLGGRSYLDPEEILEPATN